ncbi:hypothetical protein INR49_022086, partial [Caranx melampygus]
MLDFAQKTEPGTLHLLLQQQLSSSSGGNYHVLHTKLLSTIEPQELQCLLQTHSTMLTGNNGVCRVLVLMAKKMLVK